MSNRTTFLIASIDRPTLRRAMLSVFHAGGAYRVFIDQKKLGPAVGRNMLIQEAMTEWVSFLDDDDCVTSDYLQRLEEEIAAHPEADVIHFRQYLPNGHILPSWPTVEWGNVGISFSIKREVALEFPFLDEPHEDYRLMKRLQKAGKNIYFSKYITYRVRH